MTSFFRKHFTERAVKEIHERTVPGSFQIHIYDNGSDKDTQEFLISLLQKGQIMSLVLDSRNTGCLYNKLVFHAMTESDEPFYVVTDNDIYPPKLSPDWLFSMIAIMEKYPEIALLTPQLPPVSLMGPDPLRIRDDVVFCQAVGNALKLIRRSMFPYECIQESQKIGSYGDDGYVSSEIKKRGGQIAFCRKIFCLHAGQTVNWGYKENEIFKDPRKGNYNPPLILDFDPETYVPLNSTYIL
jgi:GT2 family glycosyltransferase